MKYSVLITESEEELKEKEKAQKLVQFQKRVHFLWLLKSGTAKTQEQAGVMVGWKLRNAQKIWQIYREGGLTGVLHKNERWHFGKLSSQELARLKNYLAEFGADSLGEVRDYIETAFGASYTVGGVSWLCARMKIKLKTARPANAKKDEAKAQAYKKTLAS